MADPITPPQLIFDPHRSWRVWLIKEIYLPGKTGDTLYVPNVDDMVWDWDQGLHRVIAVDYTTGVSTLQKWQAPKDPNVVDNLDILLGVGPGYQSESYRAFLDTSVTPHTLALDSRLHIYGSTNASYKVFLGTDIGEETGEVISANYDQSGVFLGENIPLEADRALYGATVPADLEQVVVKVPMVGYTNKRLPDGEVVTVVIYDSVGGVRSVAKVLIKNTAFSRAVDSSMKYVTGISLETPFLSPSDQKVIQYPVNMPVGNLNLIGVVNYSDGSKLRIPVDGTKFVLHGLDNYIATQQGQKIPLVLVYRLADNEYAYNTTPTSGRTITERFQATTLKNDGAYNVKMFAYPVWIDRQNGYRLEYFLYNGERQDYYNVTSLVQGSIDGRAFDPSLFGTVQHIAAAVDLNRVDPRFAAYRHVQSFAVTLFTHGDDKSRDNWTVGFSPGQDPAYGVGLQAKTQFINTGNWRFDVTCGATTKAEWLNKVFYATQPIYDEFSEPKAPEPNFFVLVSGTHEVEVPIDQWANYITAHESPREGGAVYIRFIRRNSTTDLHLGISGLIVHQELTP